MSDAAAGRAAIIDALVEIAPDIDPSTIRGGAPLQETYELDSMDFLAVLEEIAARTGVEIPERDLAQVETLDACTAYVAARGGAVRR
jgi:acyl carrier protein